MKKLLIHIQSIQVKSRLRVPLYVLTLITGTVFFLIPNTISPTYFVICLGLLVIFESIYPKGYITIFQELTNFLTKGLQKLVIYVMICLLILMGAFILFIGLAIELYQLRH
ncbi:MAG TPA: hypothetical protein VEY70_10250 [Metabacillus sp.]|nr:hypothetical protein [Metabacillus sp.]